MSEIKIISPAVKFNKLIRVKSRNYPGGTLTLDPTEWISCNLYIKDDPCKSFIIIKFKKSSLPDLKLIPYNDEFGDDITANYNFIIEEWNRIISNQ